MNRISYTKKEAEWSQERQRRKRFMEELSKQNERLEEELKTLKKKFEGLSEEKTTLEIRYPKESNKVYSTK